MSAVSRTNYKYVIAGPNIRSIRKEEHCCIGSLYALQIVNYSTARNRLVRKGKCFGNMERKMDSLVEFSPMELKNYHNIQESLLEDRLVENASGSRSGYTLMESDLHLDHIGQVTVTLSENTLIWQSKTAEDKLDAFSLPCFKLASLPHEFPLSEVYAVECYGWGPVRRFVGASSVQYFLKPVPQMHRFVLHSFQRLRSNRCKWVPKTYVFAHPELEICQKWVRCLQSLLKDDPKRPKNLLVVVNPYGGKGNASGKWEMVAPLFSRAGVKTKVLKTERSGHAFNMMHKVKDEELKCHDGVVVVGGDGLFNEILNGLALERHSAPMTPTPQQVAELIIHPVCTSTETEAVSLEAHGTLQSVPSDSQPLLTSTSDAILPSSSEAQKAPVANGPMVSDALMSCNSSPLVPWLRIGIIPAGSTDTIVISTTGTRDPVTAALHIILGDSMPLDVVRLTRWGDPKETDIPRVRYAASFSGYGFYGDVAKESEVLRWMGPARYDYAGTKVFMRHRKYEAEVSYLEIPDDSEKLICRVNCSVCAKGLVLPADGKLKWRSSRGFFHSVGAAIMSCRNDKAPDGVVSHAHLADGLLHLILIKQCSRPAYLRQLIELTRKGGDPLGFDFVEHHKTPIFTFLAHGEQSVWNVDGEIFPARELSAQVFRGLINIFARGPEV